MTILDQIIQQKRITVAERKIARPIDVLILEKTFAKECLSAVDFIKNENKTGIIAEFKRKSPSKGIINDVVSVEEVVLGYQKAGASVISVLTDEEFFGGSTADLIKANEILKLPILRKDFIIDPYQVYETKAMGADLILLIAEVLTKQDITTLSTLAQEIGLEVLLELHSDDQLYKIMPTIDIVGVNNRDLKTFTLDLDRSIDLMNKIPDGYLKITESGISSTEDLIKLREAGFEGFLIGENFMKEANPAHAIADFVAKI